MSEELFMKIESGKVQISTDVTVLGTINSVGANTNPIETDGEDSVLATKGSVKNYVEDISVPVGSIIPWLPGYFTNESNGGFTSVTVPLSDRWKECNGQNINDTESPIFNGAGRYVPNLTDDRFLMGSTSFGACGGENTNSHEHYNKAHYHSVGNGSELLAEEGGLHSHRVCAYPLAGGPIRFSLECVYRESYDYNYVSTSEGEHFHSVTGTIGNEDGDINGDDEQITSGNTDTENRPLYLSCKYIMRIK